MTDRSGGCSVTRKSLKDYATMEAPYNTEPPPPQNAHHILKKKKLHTVTSQIGLSLEALVVTKSTAGAAAWGRNHKADCMSDSLHARALRKLAQDSFACDTSSAKKVVIERSAHKKTKSKAITQLALWKGKRPESVSHKHQQQRGSSSSSGVAEGAASGIDSMNCSSLHNLQKSSMYSDLQLPDLSSIMISQCHPTTTNRLKFLNTRHTELSKVELSLEAELQGSETHRSSGQSLICVAGNPSSKNVTVSAAAARLVEAANGLLNLGTGGGGSQDEIAVSGIPRMCGGSSKILDQSGPNLIVERSRGSRIKDILVKSTGLQKPGAQGKKSWTWSTIPTPAAAVDTHPCHNNIIRGNLRSSSSSSDTDPKKVQQLTIDEKLSEMRRTSNPWSGILPQDFRLASDLPPLHHYSSNMTRTSINCCQAMKYNKTETCTAMARSPAEDGASLQKDQHSQATQQHIRVYKKKASRHGAGPSPPQQLPAFDKKKELVDCNASTIGRTVHIPSRHKGGKLMNVAAQGSLSESSSPQCRSGVWDFHCRQT
ncbi:unnamed protein product [Sphagnum jensenii]|uniref:Uncharacterized protein n=1 Tax=Sphagnum jensenii TaxID=128206 RepID=A0ABP1AKJ1_9BRYO